MRTLTPPFCSRWIPCDCHHAPSLAGVYFVALAFHLILKFLYVYTAFRLTTQSQVCPKLLTSGSFFRRQHFSYPYWTDFAYRSSHWSRCAFAVRVCEAQGDPWVGFRLLILLSVVLVSWRLVGVSIPLPHA